MSATTITPLNPGQEALGKIVDHYASSWLRLPVLRYLDLILECRGRPSNELDEQELEDMLAQSSDPLKFRKLAEIAIGIDTPAQAIIFVAMIRIGAHPNMVLRALRSADLRGFSGDVIAAVEAHTELCRKADDMFMDALNNFDTLREIYGAPKSGVAWYARREAIQLARNLVRLAEQRGADFATVYAELIGYPPGDLADEVGHWAAKPWTEADSDYLAAAGRAEAAAVVEARIRA
jgi:hypothetical protein